MTAVVSAEAPLRVFVSSVMRPETVAARLICFKVLSTPPFVPWMWEHTPAAPSGPRDAYVTGVRDADIVVWLVTAETSPAVADEVNAALEADKKLLAFCLTQSRDAETRQLLARVRRVSKTADVADDVDLELQLPH